MVVVCLAIAFAIRYGPLAPFPWSTLLVLVVLTVIAFVLQGLYSRFIFLNRGDTAAAIIKATVGIAVTFVFLHFVTNFKVWEQSRLVIGLYFLFFLFGSGLLRLYVFRWLFAVLYKHKILRKARVLICDAHKRHTVSKMALNMRRNHIGYELVGDFDGTLDDLHKIVAETEPEKIMLLSHATTYKNLYEEMKYVMRTGKEFAVVSKLINHLNMSHDVQKLGGSSVVWFGNGVHSANRDGVTTFIKRLIDLIVSFVSIIIFAPFMAIISLLIKLTSKGPIVFRQQRFTKDAIPFTFMKFRTMYEGVSVAKHKDFVKDLINNGNSFQKSKRYKMSDDERITPFGNILRKTSLDELPQFFNILKGEMSLVGPRPPIDYEVKQYQEWHRDRLKVKQGLTGPWQVFGRSSLPFDAAVFLDLYYVYNQSILLDLELILRTIPSVLKGKGAA